MIKYILNYLWVKVNTYYDGISDKYSNPVLVNYVNSDKSSSVNLSMTIISYNKIIIVEH